MRAAPFVFIAQQREDVLTVVLQHEVRAADTADGGDVIIASQSDLDPISGRRIDDFLTIRSASTNRYLPNAGWRHSGGCRILVTGRPNRTVSDGGRRRQ